MGVIVEWDCFRKKCLMKKVFILTFISAVILLVSAGCTAGKNNAVTALPPVNARAAAPASPTPTEQSIVTSTPAPSPTDIPSPTPTAAVEVVASPTPTELLPSPTPDTSLPTATPENPAVPAQPASLTTQDCIDKAAFSDDVTIPDGTLERMGDSFTKTWKIHNEGTCDWVGYTLIYAGGEAMNAAMSTPLQEIKPGDYANISINLQAPMRGGGHTGYFQFMNAAGKTFGVGAGAQGLIWVQINVDYLTPTPDAQSTSSQASTSQSSTSQISTSQSSNSQSSTSQNSTSQASTSSTTTGGCTYTRNSDYENQIVGLINDARAQNGLSTLTVDSKLTAAALAHSIDMACGNFISHTGSDGSSWYDRVKAQGFANYTTTRENIYVGDPTFGGDAQGAFTWWMNSKIHHDNILNPTVTDLGIAYVYDASSTYGGYYTLDLARP